MTGPRFVARCFDVRRGKWGIIDRESKKWTMVTTSQRWTSSEDVAKYNAEKWNEVGHRVYSGV